MLARKRDEERSTKCKQDAQQSQQDLAFQETPARAEIINRQSGIEGCSYFTTIDWEDVCPNTSGSYIPSARVAGIWKSPNDVTRAR